MIKTDLRLLQETSERSLPKLREIAQGLRERFPNLHIPSVLERTPEKDLFKATSIKENPLETSVVDEYMDYCSRRILGQIKTSDYGQGYRNISYSHRPSPNVEEVLNHSIDAQGHNMTEVTKRTYTSDLQHVVEERRFSPETSIERVRTFDPVSGKEISHENIYHDKPVRFQDTKAITGEKGSKILTTKGHFQGKELITTVEKDSEKAFATVTQIRDGKLHASVQKNAENGDIIMELPIIDFNTGNITGGKIKYTFYPWGSGKQVEIISKDGITEASQIYGKSGQMVKGFNNSHYKYIARPQYNASKHYIEHNDSIGIHDDIIRFLQ